MRELFIYPVANICYDKILELFVIDIVRNITWNSFCFRMDNTLLGNIKDIKQTFNSSINNPYGN